MLSVLDLFKIGLGPSSSHTMGPMKAALLFVDELIAQQRIHQVQRLRIELFGSLGATGRGHATDKAILLGLMGEKPATVDVDQIATMLQTIRQQKKIALNGQHIIDFDEKSDLLFHARKSLPDHPNGMQYEAYQQDGQLICRKIYYSVGGGFVQTSDPMHAQGAPALVEVPYPFNNCRELLAICEQHHLSISEVVLQNELTWRTMPQINAYLLAIWTAMQQCVARGCRSTGILPGGLQVKRRAALLYQDLQQKKSSDSLEAMDWVNMYALAVNEENAAGGRVVTAPTNGAAGIVPAVLHYYWHFIAGATEEGVLRFLLTSGAIGLLFKKNASISGAEVGCQGEVGSACSMATAGLTAVLGGTPRQIENAAEIGIEHHLGLTCDPVAGLVQIPCIERNAVAAVTAISASRLALHGDGQHIVSLDTAIQTMRDTGRDMKNKYKETSRGGLAMKISRITVNVVEC